MKKNRIYTVIILISILLLNSEQIIGKYPQEKVKIATEERTVPDFNEIKLKCSADVYISQGNSISVRVEADEPIINRLRTDVVNNKTLIIYTVKNLEKALVMKVYITVKDLSYIEVSGSGDLESVSEITTDKLNVFIKGSGNLKLNLNTNEISGEIKGSGDMEISGINGLLDIIINDSGDLKADKLKLSNCKINIKGSGDAKLSGSTNILDINSVSSGDINAYNLQSKKCKIYSNGSGDSKINVSDELDVTLWGSGNAYYKGNPKIKNKDISGSGELKKAG
ncbi:MAG: DUF2807 domain-containing protein [Bacteroidales bacterium]|nr:DUF2807 domain-containing protein [Bacteroidales bacterium]